MKASSTGSGRVYWVALRAMVMFTVVVGVAYTLVITGIGLLVLPAQARGSALRAADGHVAGSALIGQSFMDADGNPLPQYFQPRPSAAGKGYDGASSSGSNLGPENPDLVKAIACGADSVMLGAALARATEAPGRGWHWGPEAHHQLLPRGERVEVGTAGSLEQILFGPGRTADGTLNLIGALRRAMATTGYSDLKEFQRVEVVVSPYQPR